MFLVILMGVSGCGKSAICRELCQKYNQYRFLEGDDYHSDSNKQKMSSGQFLTDADRKGWLDSIIKAVHNSADEWILLSCSALKKAYREYLRTEMKERQLILIYLKGSKEILLQRLNGRKHHPIVKQGHGAFLENQLTVLEEPDVNEKPLLVVSIEQSIDQEVEQIHKYLTSLKAQQSFYQ